MKNYTIEEQVFSDGKLTYFPMIKCKDNIWRMIHDNKYIKIIDNIYCYNSYESAFKAIKKIKKQLRKQPLEKGKRVPFVIQTTKYKI